MTAQVPQVCLIGSNGLSPPRHVTSRALFLGTFWASGRIPFPEMSKENLPVRACISVNKCGKHRVMRCPAARRDCGGICPQVVCAGTADACDRLRPVQPPAGIVYSTKVGRVKPREA